jgi:hypothetical protein
MGVERKYQEKGKYKAWLKSINSADVHKATSVKTLPTIPEHSPGKLLSRASHLVRTKSTNFTQEHHKLQKL